MVPRDLVAVFDMLEHFCKDELVGLVDQAARVLRPGGKFLVHAPNGESPFCGRVRYAGLTHELAFTRESLPQLLNACGFSQVDCYEDLLVTRGVVSVLRWLLWHLIRFAVRRFIAMETGVIDAKMIFSQSLLCVAIK